MPRRIIDFDDPDRFASGAAGTDEERTFFLQAVKGGRVASVALEQEQVAILADRLITFIDELERRGLAAIDLSQVPATREPSLAEPLHEEFRVGTLMIAWDDDIDRLVIEARSATIDDGVGESASARLDELEDDEIPDDAPIGPDVLRVRLRPLMAQRFARHAGVVAADGRPPCPFCGRPLDATGHLCPRPDGGDHVH